MTSDKCYFCFTDTVKLEQHKANPNSRSRNEMITTCYTCYRKLTAYRARLNRFTYDVIISALFNDLRAKDEVNVIEHYYPTENE